MQHPRPYSRRPRPRPHQRASLLLLLAAPLWVACAGDDDGGVPARVPAEQEVGGPYAPDAPDSAARTVRQIAEGVYTYEYARGGDPVTTVSMFVVTDEGVLVADGQGSQEETRRLLDEIAAVTDQPVTHLVIASDHRDHTAGNAAFPAAVEVYAHPFARDVLSDPATGYEGPAPTTLVTGREALELGGRSIEVLFLGRGHTAGDLAVHLPGEQIVFMSEAFLDRVFPLMITAFPSDWVETLRVAEALDAETYVAGHGVRDSVDWSASNLTRYREAVEQVIAEVRRLHGTGMAVEDAIEQANFGALARQADYVYQMERAVRRVWAELEGELE